MNIVIVSQYFWPENFRINDLAEGMKKRGHNITVLTGMPNYPAGKLFKGYNTLKPSCESYGGVIIKRVPLIPRGDGSKIRLILNYLSFALSACITVPFLKFGKFDAVFVFEPSPITVCLPAIVLKKLKRKPLFLWVQDLWPESLTATGSVRSRRIIRLVEQMVRYIYSKCDMILIQSKAFFNPVRKLADDHRKIKYFPNSAEETYCMVEVEKSTTERNLFPDGFCITFAGNVGVAQDFNTIIEAAEKLKQYHDIHFIILGNGRMMPWLKKKIKEKNIEMNFHLLGAFPVETMPKFFALSDALLVTLRREEIFSLTIPSKIQSYLACGKPVIAALDGEGARIIMEAKAGIACRAEDPDGLASATLSLYNAPEKAREIMGANGLKYFKKHFDRTKLMGKLEKWMMDEMKKDISKI